MGGMVGKASEELTQCQTWEAWCSGRGETKPGTQDHKWCSASVHVTVSDTICSGMLFRHATWCAAQRDGAGIQMLMVLTRFATRRSPPLTTLSPAAGGSW
jgi:hypothetical protein